MSDEKGTVYHGLTLFGAIDLDRSLEDPNSKRGMFS